ncbi:MAG: DUF4238 domain-containing protein [Pirellulaceae bacterium]
MQRVKNQHYVPRFYLKAFCADGKSLFVFDKVKQNSFKTGVANVASVQRFYDFPPAPDRGGDSQIVEKAFSKLEGGYAAAIRDLLDEVQRNGGFTPGIIERNLGVAHFLVFQFCRTRGFRNTYARMVEEFSAAVAKEHELVRQHLASQGLGGGPPMSPITIPDEMASLEHAEFMFVGDFANRVMPILMHHIWSVAVNDTPQPLLTSDAPVVLYPHVTHPLLGGAGFGCPGIEILLPLSPRYLLVIRERGHFAPLMRPVNPQPDGAVLPLKPAGVELYNRLQVANCYRWVYCPEDKFEQVRELIKQFPEVCDQDRPRFSVLG